MKRNFKIALASLVLVIGESVGIYSMACTSAVISGKATPDGRPLLWKNRDTDYLPNHIAFVNGEKYRFIANVNSENFDSLKEAWIGMNEKGFAIMNTQSYNLVDVKPGEERGAANGSVIYRALELCETVEDFEHLLDTISKPSLIEANFGVIDAKGGAAIYEVDYYNYTKYDANDKQTAPLGYIARTNFSVSGKENKGLGYVRYMEADSLLTAAALNGGVTPEFIYSDCSRSYHNPVLGVDLKNSDLNWFVDQDFIPRNITSCSVVVQGNKEGENPETNVMWTLLGYPGTGVAVPLFIDKDGKGLPAMMTYDDELKAAPLSDASLKLADEVFGFEDFNGTDKYLNWEKLYNKNGTGIMQRLMVVENGIMETAAPLIEKWRQAGAVNPAELEEYYTSIGAELEDFLNAKR